MLSKNQHKIALTIIALIILWNITAWMMVRNFYFARVEEAIKQRTELSRERATDLADSIARNLNYLHGISDLLSKLPEVRNATLRFGKDITPSTLPIDERRKRWTHDPMLKDLSHYLALARGSLHTDIVFVINAAGDCIAASNWNTFGSSIGENFADRDYFRENKNRQHGIQYAIGKTTNIPGIYFSTPIIDDGHFLGAVVTKIDVPKLSFLVKELDAFVTDENGVIVLANDQHLLMHAVPGAYIDKMSLQKKIARYKRSNFPALLITSWGDRKFPSLMRFQDEYAPHVFSTMGIAQYGMKVYVSDHVFEYRSLNRDAAWFALLLEISGSILILMVGGAMLYMASIKAKEVALERANRAERRIISISEDTQQRIGRELHDDVGQLLTGVAFMSEVLSKKLTGRAEASDAAKITAFINEAILKTGILARGLYPVELKEADLPSMLKNFAKNTEDIFAIKCQFTCECQHAIDDPLVAINLFRIAQEAVNNAIKHGKSTNITLKLVSLPTEITLEINDDGSGISPSSDSKAGLGLRSMQYRASLLGGTSRITPLPDGGTSVTVNLPV